MKSLTREQIFHCSDQQVERVPAPEWGGDVYVRSMTGTERDKFEATTLVKDKGGTYEVQMENLRARLVIMTACDEKGELIFSPKDAHEVGKHNAAVVSRLYDVATRLSGITKSDIDELVKNSNAAQIDETT